MRTARLHLVLTLFAVLGLVAGAGAAAAQSVATPAASPVASPSAAPVAAQPPAGPADLDVLFIGAHPDDEAGGLSAYGQWSEESDVRVGVITITRGEGGGNAVGTEEGPALGLLREAEERRAVGLAGIERIYNLDKVDFYYTVSASLTEDVWGYDETLERVVRVVRETTPDVIITMNPSPTPGNHGHHQMAARLAVAAYYAAADPEMYAAQIEQEGLEAWRAEKILRRGAAGEGQPGEGCAGSFQAEVPTDYVFGVWAGHTSESHGGATWAQTEIEAQREYVSQGWATFEDAPSDPAEIECDYFTLIDSRVPFTVGSTDPTAVLEGAVVPAVGGLPLDTEFYLTLADFYVQAGAPVTVTATARAAGGGPVEGTVALTLPDGWTATGTGELRPASDNGQSAATFIVTPVATAEPATRYRLDATLTASGGTGTTSEVLEVVPPVRGTLQALPEIEAFREWAQELGVPQLDALIKPRLSLGSGQSREIQVDLRSFSVEPQSGTVALELPTGFEAAESTQDFADLPPGGSADLVFTVTNTDGSLPTANEGGEEGDYNFNIVTTAGQVTSSQTAALNLVPVTAVPPAGAGLTASPVAGASPVAVGSPVASPISASGAAPNVDGQVAQGEYAGETLDLSRVWEGDDPESPQDASGTAQVVWAEDGLYFAVNVTDDTLGTVLPPEDAKRHWRTDSVEIAIDPLGTAENTSSTFKVGIFPVTEGGGPAAYRDADAQQGPIAETAPGMQLASTVSDPFSGYVIETFIPFDALPAPVDPENMTLNIFIYDSDTQDRTGQTRLGWSTWQGVQGDPYRWGKAILEGYPPLADAALVEVEEPVIPLEVAQSTNSPQSIAQSAEDDVPLAGTSPPAAGEGVTITEEPVVQEGQVTIGLTSGAVGTVHLFVMLADRAIAGEQTVELQAGTSQDVVVPAAGVGTGSTLLVSFESEDGGVQALAVAL